MALDENPKQIWSYKNIKTHDAFDYIINVFLTLISLNHTYPLSPLVSDHITMVLLVVRDTVQTFINGPSKKKKMVKIGYPKW